MTTKVIEIKKEDLPLHFGVRISNPFQSEMFQKWAFQILGAKWYHEPQQIPKHIKAESLFLNKDIQDGQWWLTWDGRYGTPDTPFIDFDLAVVFSRSVEVVNINGIEYAVGDVQKAINTCSVKAL